MKAKDVKKLLNVTQQTLYNYIKKGILNPIKINDTHYEYNQDEVYNLLGIKAKLNDRINITYARVSLPKQKNDLDSQNQRLYNFCLNKGIKLDMQLTDVKSGMEFNNRKNFQKLISLVCQNKVKYVIIENKDRLVRFGFDLINEVCKQHHTEIIVMSNVDNKSYEQELTDDLISIIHYYSMKSDSNRRKLNKAKEALKENIDD